MLHVAYYILVLTYSNSSNIIALIADAHSRVVCLCVCFLLWPVPCAALPLLAVLSWQRWSPCLPTYYFCLASSRVACCRCCWRWWRCIALLPLCLPTYLPACLTDSLLTTNSHKWWTCWTRLLWPRNGNVIPLRTSFWYFASFLFNFTPMYALRFSFPLLLNASTVSFLFTLIREMYILNFREMLM